MKTAIPYLCLLMAALALHDARAQNLLQNPGCEPSGGGAPAGWTNASGGQWTCQQGGALDFPATHDGDGFFYAGNTIQAELYQDVDVSSDAADIDTGHQQYAFSGYTQSFGGQVTTDRTRIVVEYRDAANTTVLDAYDTGDRTNTSAWQQVSDTRAAPSGTRFIRVRLVSTRMSGSSNDGYYDGLSLVQGDLLPVELTAFTAVAAGTGAVLRWTTASETNNAGFHVEMQRADAPRDGVSSDPQWKPVAFVEGRGTTAEAQSYGYHTDALGPGLHRFRLRQVDHDGVSAYSPEVEVLVQAPGRYVLTEVYPNPFAGQASLTLAVRQPQAVRVSLVDLLGREVGVLFEGPMPADAPRLIVVAGDGLPAGAYVVRVVGERFTAARRVLVAR